VELRAFRENNHASVTAISQRERLAELTPQQVRRLEKALGETGGSFSPRLVDSHLSYVASMPLRPVLDESQSTGIIKDDALSGKTIMVLDDQEEARDALEAVLMTVGAQVEVFASGEDALTHLRAMPTAQWPDVMLCDIVLGGEQDGYDVMRFIREEEAARQVKLGERMPAIALTGHAQAETRVRTQTAGFQAHLTKPVTAPKLIAAIGSVTTRSP
jgi:ATP-binding cassette, subfamily B, bacterial